MLRLPVVFALWLVAALSLVGCSQDPTSNIWCPSQLELPCEDLVTGCKVARDTAEVLCCPGECGGDDGGQPDGGDPGDGDPFTEDEPTEQCLCPNKAGDLDQDCIVDALEGCTSTSPTIGANGKAEGWDTDRDGIGDGCEDRDQDGQRDAGEMDACDDDSDDDGILDGVEDRNQNGRRDPGETSALSADTDQDGTPDGLEDRNQNGIVDAYADTNGNGCWDAGEPAGESDPASIDTDGDLLPDRIEDLNHNGLCDAGETCIFEKDTDCDGLRDGSEDKNHNGVFNTGETDPRNPDSDGDGIPDGVEDADGDGRWNPITETSPLLRDSDSDGIPDGVEDRNHNGVVDGLADVTGDGVYDWLGDTDGNGCWDEGEQAGESDPRLFDTDEDGLMDGTEDVDRDGACGAAETCAWLADSDCDGLSEDIEDVNHSGGAPEAGELDPRKRDTDLDGLLDGCPMWALAAGVGCEDTNNDGIVERWVDANRDGLRQADEGGETDPLDYDTDADGLSDGCEHAFTGGLGGRPDPLVEDSDRDGDLDGAEDKDQSCSYEPETETDPTVFDDGPEPGSFANAKWQVCSAQNLKDVTFARTPRPELDYQLALEVEKNTQTGEEASYIVAPFGRNKGQPGFDPATDPADVLWGHIFQSPKGVILDSADQQPVNRDVYGFVLASEDSRGLNDVVEALRGRIAALYDPNLPYALVQLAETPAREAHDDLSPNFPIERAQRRLEMSFADNLGNAPQRALKLRNDLLIDVALSCSRHACKSACEANNDAAGMACSWHAASEVCSGSAGQDPDPLSVPPTQDPVYASAPTYTKFSLYVGAVKREQQLGACGKPVVVTVVALTPDDSAQSTARARKWQDRVTRLEDLTGGSAIARFTNKTSNTCDELPPSKAAADLLWVVDDSGSMQTLISRLQSAARDAKAVLTSNSSIVDFRTAMTTTNASRGARSQCPGTSCTSACTAADWCDGLDNAACTTTAGCAWSNNACGAASSDCLGSCLDQWMGCIYMCPGSCGTGCDADTGVCACGDSCAAECDAGSCYARTQLYDALMHDAAVSGAGWALPGGGGTFYYEDNAYLDCDSSSNGVVGGFNVASINNCGSDAYNPRGAGGVGEFDPFFGYPSERRQFLAHGGMLGPDVTASCQTAPLDLSEKATSNYTTCGMYGTPCCERLTSECSDGPTVLASQMCDLIRAMGGVPGATSLPKQTGRPHASPELGVRSALRLIESMLPAWPQGYPACAGVSEALCPEVSGCAWVSNECVAADPTDTDKLHLRRTCSVSEPGCAAPCDPRVDQACTIMPLVTLFLTDEEDFWFKDECQVKRNGSEVAPALDEVDLSQLPTACYWPEACAVATSEQDCADIQGCEWSGSACSGALGVAKVCTRAYCEGQGFALGTPRGYNPDLAAWDTTRGFTVKGRPDCDDMSQLECQVTDGCTWGGSVCSAVDASCSPARVDAETSCLADPCEALTSEVACESFDGYYAEGFGGAYGNVCTWDSLKSRCRNACTAYTFAATGNALMTSSVDVPAVRSSCDADPRCEWDQARVDGLGNLERACLPKVGLNDCRACKRLARTFAALEGERGDATLCGAYLSEDACEVGFMCEWSGSACVARRLIGFEELRGPNGPVAFVYAIARNTGAPGAADDTGTLSADACNGGRLTWGRGDGTAYRDLADLTLGRKQDVCVDATRGYGEFMTQIITDIVALSAPYPLTGAPISATIKVGIARPNGSGGYEPIEVPRSNTQGFLYAPTTNSLGFKSDPIDGSCEHDPDHGTCARDGVRNTAEIQSALNAPHVPRPGDVIFVSYRYWLPVPCRNECLPSEHCARVLCTEPEAPPSCGVDSDCPHHQQFCAEEGTCQYDCVPDTVVDRCVPNPCGPCEAYDASANGGVGGCVLTTNDACVCNPSGGQICDPSGTSSCPPGTHCDESCACVENSGCPQGFQADGTVLDCAAALDCCEGWGADALECDTRAEVDCTAAVTANGGACVWGINGCASLASPCCQTSERPVCFSDPESGTKSVTCDAGVCTCEDISGVSCFDDCATYTTQGECPLIGCQWDASAGACASPCENWQTCTSGLCLPVCNPGRDGAWPEYCAVEAGCVCRQIGP